MSRPDRERTSRAGRGGEATQPTTEARIPAQRGPADEPAAFSPLAKIGVGTVGLLGLTWFFVSWLVLKSPLTDAIGETVGSLAVILLVVSIIGAARS